METGRRRFCVAAATSLALGAAAIAAPRASLAARHRPKHRIVPNRRVAAEGSSDVVDYSQRADVLSYVDELVAREGFVRDDLLLLFSEVRYNATAARLMLPSTARATRDWNVYRARFVEPVRLGAGFRFWDDHAGLLERAGRDFGVAAEIVVGILGVETVYGRNTGRFRVVDALTTLAFDYPDKERDRSSFFREQLTAALILSRGDVADASALRGSYAGAIGMPQFMPGSILRYAVDYDDDGRIDLVDSPADIIGSVANFLARHGWVRDLVTHVPLVHAPSTDPLQAATIASMVSAGSAPSLTYADLQAAGFVATKPPPDTSFALIDLPHGTDAAGDDPAVTYLAGTQNFHVITRYNRSYFYAYAVIELGGTIKALREAG